MLDEKTGRFLERSNARIRVQMSRISPVSFATRHLIADTTNNTDMVIWHEKDSSQFFFLIAQPPSVESDSHD